MSGTRQRLARQARQHLEGLARFGVAALPQGRKPSAASRPVAGQGSKAAQLTALAAEAKVCRRCPLYQTATQAVFSDGTPLARLVFVGEAPGRDEDAQGVPFVGAAGQLLTKMITAMGLKRADVYICNVLKHRPPGNRTPLPEEMEACWPFLEAQLDILRPRVICTLGAVATKALLGPYVSITRIRGDVRDYRGTPVVPTFHPAYLLRNPAAKKDAWADLKVVMRLLQAPG